MNIPSSVSGRQQRLRQITVSLLVAFLVVATALLLWSVLRASMLAERPDNPRLVERELRIRRGSIWDNENALIAGTIGPVEDPQRVYPLGAMGPAIGYYSFRHGTAGVEEEYDAVLRGDSEDEWINLANEQLHAPQTGRDIRVTLDADWQRVADTLLADHQGAAILLTLPDGAVRAMVSHPDYDPNILDQQFTELVADERSPLLNRAASQYQPGMALQPFLLAAALDEGLIALGDELGDANQPVAVNGQTVSCDAAIAEPATWADILRHRCPAPMLSLGERLGADGLDSVFAAFNLTHSPDAPIDTETPAVVSTADPLLAAIGQENLVVTPLQLGLALAALANNGNLPNLQLVSAVQDEDGVWTAVPHRPEGVEVLDSGVARRLLDALPHSDNLIAEHVAEALSGPEGRRIGWYLAVAPASAPRYVVVVMVEEDAGGAEAARAGRALLQHILGTEGNG